MRTWKEVSRKLLTGVLSLCMVVTMLPTPVHAETTDTLTASLTEAKTYIDNITQDEDNDPSTVVSNFGTHFTWDNEKRESSKSYLFDWSYYNGVVFEGLEYVYEVTGDETYKDLVIEYMSSLIASDGTWANCTNNSSKQAAGYNATHGADCYKTASLLLDAYEMTNDSRYLTMAETLYADLDTAAKSYSLSNAGNNYRHTWATDPSPDLWLDGLYMILPFRAEYAKHIGDTEELDLIVDRMQWVSDNMYDSSKGLFYHAADSATSNSGTYWLRSIGWYAAAIVDIMDSMEGDNLEAMKAQLVKLVDGMKAVQNTSNGMWLNNMNASQSSTNPYETSGTALVCYAVMKAVNEGWLDESYADMAILAFNGICEEKLSDNNLTDICFKGAPGSSNSTFYDNEGKGVGPFIMLYAEIMEYTNNDSEPDTPDIEEPTTNNTVVIEDTTITVENVTGLTGTTVTDTDKALIEAQNYTNFIAYDITATLTGDTATVSIPVPTEWNATEDELIGISVEDGEVKTIKGTLSNNIYTFEVDHFSGKGVAYNAKAITNVESVSGTSNLVGGKVYTLDTNGVTANKNYLIVNTNSGSGYALTNNDGDTDRTSVTISNNTITVENDTDIAWVFSGSASGTVSNNGRYVYPENGSVSLDTDDTNLTISNQGNGAYIISRRGGKSSYYLQYYYNNWTARTNSGNVYLYELTSSSAGEAVTFTVTPGSSTIKPDEELVLTGTVTVGGTEEDIVDCTITWTSNNSATATVNSGTVTGVADGTASITATLTAVDGVALQTPIVLTIPLTVETRVISTVELVGQIGTVYQGSADTVRTGAQIKITYDDNSVEYEYVTIEMLEGSFDVTTVNTYPNLTVVYGDYEFENFTLNIIEKPDMDYPEYPDQGSVSVEKYIADYTQFQNTGVAEVHLSTSGIPAHVGVDVILVADISNSMAWFVNAGENGESSDADKIATSSQTDKWDALQESAETFINVFLSDNDADSRNSRTVSFVTFGGYDKDRNAKSNSYTAYADSVQTHFIGSSDITEALDVINAIEITGNTSDSTYTISGMESGNGSAQGGTNYDFAFAETYDAILQLKANYENETGIEYDESGREIHVLFMTDGAPDHYNQQYYKTRSDTQFDYYALYINSTDIANGLNEYMEEKDGFSQPTTNGYFLPSSNMSQDSWVTWLKRDANAIAKKIMAEKNVKAITSVGFDMAYGGFGGWTFAEDDLRTVLTNLAGENSCEVKLATNTEELKQYYSTMASELKLAATNAYFVDQMGDSFDIQMASTVTKFKDDSEETETITLNPRPQITISTQKVYTPDDVNGTTVTSDMIGEEYGEVTTLEIVTFNNTGTQAYSTIDVDGDGLLNEDDNIMIDGVIYGKYFWYNNSGSAVKIDSNNDGQITDDDYTLPNKTFYWNIGDIDNRKFTMSYYVYLNGSAEGTKPAGTYATNNYAVLYYENWLGNDAYKDTTSPGLAWESAAVYYGFYLVDKSGNPVINRATGATGTFRDAVKVTAKMFYKEVYLNEIDSIATISVASTEVPDGYTVYDNAATYQIKINSNLDASGWEIVNGNTPDTTYVTDYYGNEYTNIIDSDKVEDKEGWDYTATTVWFAVVWEPSTVSDTVVIDFGLPVDIDVLENDMFGTNGSLIGIGRYEDIPDSIKTPNSHTATESSLFSPNYTGTYGDAEIKNGEIRYTPKTTEMSTYDKFAYEALYDNGKQEDIGYYYGDVTVIPATTIYYEDTFVKYTINDGTSGKVTSEQWTPMTDENYKDETIVQAEDRPGYYNISYIDANNVYGYDAAYNNMSQYSLGSIQKVSLDDSNYATATFKYWGTGFDVISLTNSTSGTIIVDVYPITGTDTNGNDTLGTNSTYLVDTYYGYEKVEGDNPDTENVKEEYYWQVSETSDTLYQIPVMRVTNSSYGHYKVVITAVYADLFDHLNKGTYDFYLDAIRIYNPANDGVSGNDTTIKDAYVADNEYQPYYYEVRNMLIQAAIFENIDPNNSISGIVFIDDTSEDATTTSVSVSDYTNYGPNNEVYLAKNQSIAFDLTADNADKVHLAFKGVEGDASLRIYGLKGKTENDTTTYSTVSDRTYTIKTATALYYDITSLNGTTVVLTNTGDNIVSITNVKVTHPEEPEVTTASVFSLRRSSINLALASLNEPETFEPETFNVEVNDTVQVGKKSTVTVTTSNDVENITINDVTYTSYKTDKTTGQRIWTVKLEAETEGEMNIEVFASNADGILSDPITKTITVTAKKANNNSSKPSSNRNEINLYPQYKGFKDLLEDEDIVFIDEEGKASIYDNDKSGKEVYLEENQAITFNLDASHLTLKDILVGIKALEETGKVEIYTVTTNNEGEVIVENQKTLLLNKTSDLYQEITDYNQKTVVIKNTGKAPISLTNLKVTYIKSTGTNEEVITMDEETLGYVLETMAKEKEYFTPEMMEVSVDKEKVKVGKKVTVEVVTSDDVECITVNGETCTTYKTDKKTGLRTWKVKVEAEEVGEMMIEVIGYNEINIESLPIENTITVAPRKTITIFGNMIEDLLDMFFGMFR